MFFPFAVASLGQCLNGPCMPGNEFCGQPFQNAPMYCTDCSPNQKKTHIFPFHKYLYPYISYAALHCGAGYMRAGPHCVCSLSPSESSIIRLLLPFFFLRFHLMDQHGCGENDPNGPVFDPVHGVIHHFYQIHLAARPGHGPDYGHFVSKDFVNWVSDLDKLLPCGCHLKQFYYLFYILFILNIISPSVHERRMDGHAYAPHKQL